MSAFIRPHSECLNSRARIRQNGNGRENAKDTLCRNVTIYGHCRYEDKGCAFNHDPVKSQPNSQVESIKKRFNIASPSFTPSSLAVNGNHATPKTLGLSPKAANAAPFKPRTLTPGNIVLMS
ncbi:hypothetical protein HO133_006458 [Letharia lupina]|uniref:C3H1-type domain-containing protein n=1 Tax=Letharia lupina TaxID=560253 RepID=A0A8H6F7P8_9LECA|nr:uncharacterized protein HO133_006458 [Letharia lupina]KAF6218046.1 hypothetical protein HO133_006458 [Letharia lupina]